MRLLHLSLRTLVWFAFALMVGGLVLAAYISFHVLPHLDQYRAELTRELSAALGRPVTLERLQGQWTGTHLRLTLHRLNVADRSGHAALEVTRAEGELSWWTLLDRGLRFRSLDVQGVSLRLGRDSTGLLWLGDRPLPRGSGDASAPDWLLRQGRIQLRDTRLLWQDALVRPGRPLQLERVELLFERGFFMHQLTIQAAVPGLAVPWQLDASWRGDRLAEFDRWRGRARLRLPVTPLAEMAPWLLPGETVQAGVAQADVTVEFARGRVQQGQLALDARGLQLRGGEGLLPIARLVAEASFRRTAAESSVQFGLLRLQLADTEPAQSLDSTVVRWRGEGAGRHTTVRVPGVDLAPLGALLARSWPRSSVAGAQLSGRVNQIELDWQGPPLQPRQWQVGMRLEQAGWKMAGSLPSVKGLSGRLQWREREGSFDFSAPASRGLQLDWPAAWNEPRELHRVTGQLGWKWQGDELQVTVREGRLASGYADMTVDGLARWRAGFPLHLDLDARLGTIDIAAAKHWLPLQLHEDTRKWLHGALHSGQLQRGFFSVHGSLGDIGSTPSGQPVLRAGADLVGVGLAYTPGWPMLEQIDGQMLFEDKAMRITARSARIHGTQVGATQVVLPDMTIPAARLQVNGVVTGATRQFLDFVRASPLHDSIGSVTDLFDAQGSGTLTLGLDIPLAAAADTRVQGRYVLANNTLAARGPVPDVAGVTGTIDFTERGVVIDRLVGRGLGGEVQVQAMTRSDGVTELDINGQADVRAVTHFYELPLADRASGRSAYRVQINNGQAGLSLNVQSDLVGTTIDLPAPFGKVAPEAARTTVALVMTRTGQENWTVVSQQGLAAVLRYDAGPNGRGRVFDRGTLTVGSTQPVAARRPGLWLTGSLPLVQASDWLGLLSQGGAGADMRLQGVFLTVDGIAVQGRILPAVTLDMTLTDARWTGTIQSSLGRGVIEADQRGAGRVRLQFDTLNWPERSLAAPMSPGVPAALDPSGWPAIDVVVERLRRNGQDLGRLSLVAGPTAGGYQVQDARLFNDDGDLHARLQWSRPTRGAWQGDLQFEVAARDAGRLFGRFGLARVVVQGHGTLQGQLSWQGGVMPVLADVRGTVKANAAKGTLLRVNPGVGRLLGLLNIESVLRRVRLDFKDVLSEGLAIDEMRAQGRFDQGRFILESLEMVGPAVALDASGQIQLASGGLDLQVRVVPSVSGGVSVAGAVVNPLVGLSLLVLQQVFSNPVGKMLTYTYNIGGTWREPDIRTRPGAAQAP